MMMDDEHFLELEIRLRLLPPLRMLKADLAAVPYRRFLKGTIAVVITVSSSEEACWLFDRRKPILDAIADLGMAETLWFEADGVFAPGIRVSKEKTVRG